MHDNAAVGEPHRILDVVLGSVLGGVVAAIVAVNFIITFGVGYDVSLGDVFVENRLLGVATVAILLAGPVVGAVVMRRGRRKRGKRR